MVGDFPRELGLGVEECRLTGRIKTLDNEEAIGTTWSEHCNGDRQGLSRFTLEGSSNGLNSEKGFQLLGLCVVVGEDAEVGFSVANLGLRSADVRI